MYCFVVYVYVQERGGGICRSVLTQVYIWFVQKQLAPHTHNTIHSPLLHAYFFHSVALFVQLHLVVNNFLNDATKTNRQCISIAILLFGKNVVGGRRNGFGNLLFVVCVFVGGPTRFWWPNNKQQITKLIASTAGLSPTHLVLTENLYLNPCEIMAYGKRD